MYASALMYVFNLRLTPGGYSGAQVVADIVLTNFEKGTVHKYPVYA